MADAERATRTISVLTLKRKGCTNFAPSRDAIRARSETVDAATIGAQREQRRPTEGGRTKVGRRCILSRRDIDGGNSGTATTLPSDMER